MSQMVAGRSPSCDLVIGDDPKVSRLHARFTVHEQGVMVEDLQSANGVFINGLRVNGKTGLRAGDTVRLGDQEMRVVESTVPRGADTADSAPTTIPIGPFERRPMTLRSMPSEKAFDWMPLREAIRREELERAAVLLRVALDRMLDEASMMGRLPARAREELCDHVLVLASKTHDGFWLNMLFHLHTLLVQPLPHAVAAVLPHLVHEVRGLDRLALEAYVMVLRRGRERMSPVERSLCVAVESALIIASSSSR